MSTVGNPAEIGAVPARGRGVVPVTGRAPEFGVQERPAFRGRSVLMEPFECRDDGRSPDRLSPEQEHESSDEAAAEKRSREVSRCGAGSVWRAHCRIRIVLRGAVPWRESKERRSDRCRGMSFR